MNKNRRRTLLQLIEYLEQLKRLQDKEEAVKIVEECQKECEMCADQEQEALDNRPETLECSTMNDTMQDNIDDLYDVSGDLELLAGMCQEMTAYSYELIKSEVIAIINQIKEVIHR